MPSAASRRGTDASGPCTAGGRVIPCRRRLGPAVAGQDPPIMTAQPAVIRPCRTELGIRFQISANARLQAPTVAHTPSHDGIICRNVMASARSTQGSSKLRRGICRADRAVPDSKPVRKTRMRGAYAICRHAAGPVRHCRSARGSDDPELADANLPDRIKFGGGFAEHSV